MLEKFVKATVQTIPNSYKLNFTCINGAPVSNRSLTVSGETRYVDGTEFKNGDSLMFCLDEDEGLLPGFYPFKDPQGNLESCAGGKGKGSVSDVEQRSFEKAHSLQQLVSQRQSSSSDLASQPSPLPVTSVLPLQVSWINGIWMSETIDIVLDPAYGDLPFGAEVYFSCSFNPDGLLQVDYVALSLGDCGNPD